MVKRLLWKEKIIYLCSIRQKTHKLLGLAISGQFWKLPQLANPFILFIFFYFENAKRFKNIIII